MDHVSNNSVHGDPTRRVGSKGIKRHHSKVRSGCKSCRDRRVKCDEAKPKCGRCSRLTLTCIFDRLQPTDINAKVSRSVAIVLSNDTPRSGLQNNGPYSVANLNIPQGQPDEQRFMQFYLLRTKSRYDRQTTALEAFTTTGLVFLQWAPQIAQTSQAVRSAISAAASAEENQWAHGNASTWLTQRQQYYYHTVVSEILNGNILIEEILLCCCLMFTYSCFSRDYNAAELHLRSGLRLIEEHKQRVKAPVLFAVERALKDLEPSLALVFQNRPVKRVAASRLLVSEYEAHVELRQIIKLMEGGHLEDLNEQFQQWKGTFEASRPNFSGTHTNMVSHLYDLSTFVFNFITAPRDPLETEKRRLALSDQLLEHILAQNDVCTSEDVKMLQNAVRNVKFDVSLNRTRRSI